MKIHTSTPEDLAAIFDLYRAATDLMRSKKKVTVWPEFDKNMVLKEINESRQYKLVHEEDILCVWAIAFSDPQIWQERNKDKAIYIHRIATHPERRGNNYVKLIVDWAKAFVTENKIDFIRMDTIGNNTKLIEHYKRNGFDFLGMFEMKETDGLPEHYKEGPACLFEIDMR